LSGADGVASGESIGDRQKQSDQRVLIFRVDFQHVKADALGRARLIEEAVKMRPLEGLRDGVFVNLLQIEHGASNECAAICHMPYFIFHMKYGMWSLNIPQDVCGQRRPGQGAAVTEDGDQFVEVFDLQSVVEGEAKTMRPVKERQRANREQ